MYGRLSPHRVTLKIYGFSDELSRHTRCIRRRDPFQLPESASGACVSGSFHRTIDILCPILMLYSCQRLSLTPLCYLWQRDQTELLEEMSNAGLEAIMIKVAGAGLTPAHLGKTLTKLRRTLMKLVGTFHSLNKSRVSLAFLARLV